VARPIPFPPGSPAIAGALLLLAVAIVGVRIPFRTELRDQIAHRDVRILAALIQQQIDDSSGTTDPQDPLVAALAASLAPDLPGLLALQIYSPEGQLFATLLGPTNAASVPAPCINRSTTPVTHYIADQPPRLQVWLPIQPAGTPDPVGFTFLTLDASDLAAEYDELDAGLSRQSLVAFLAVGLPLALFLGFAFHRLDLSRRLLADRTARLEQANRDLALAARTSAIGTITSHLVHGLRNPLAALQQAVADDRSPDGAATTTRRMSAMVDEVVRVLRDEQGLDGFEIPAAELVSETCRRGRLHTPVGKIVHWESEARDGPPLDNRSANLALLILENLVTNAVQNIQDHGTIRIRSIQTSNTWRFQVSDNGPGIPPEIRSRLFTPSQSGRPGGSGLGLAISRHLAFHLGGTLELDHSTPGDTRFTLLIPLTNQPTFPLSPPDLSGRNPGLT